MLAGHIVIFALISLLVMFGIAALPVLALVVLVFFLELLVAFLQAFIFTLLSAIFIGQLYHPEH
jgi:F-type H+-transporting ATPase subunit a